MAEKWQQWMPFHIDRFFASSSVQAMDPAARMGYLSLLTRGQWQSDDCSIPSDQIDLADISGLGDELWEKHSSRILRNFEVLENGRLRNEVCYQEWMEAKRVFERRKAAADRTNSERWGNGKQSVTDHSPNRFANTITGTYTVTDTQVPNTAQSCTEIPSSKQKPFSRTVPPEELAGTLPLAGGGSHQIPKSDIAEWSQAFPGVDVRGELKKMKVWLDANPTRKKTVRGIRRAIVSWLDRAQNDSRRNGGSNGQGNAASQPSAAKQRVDANLRAVAATALRRGWIRPDSFTGTDGEEMAEPRPCGVD